MSRTCSPCAVCRADALSSHQRDDGHAGRGAVHISIIWEWGLKPEPQLGNAPGMHPGLLSRSFLTRFTVNMAVMCAIHVGILLWNTQLRRRALALLADCDAMWALVCNLSLILLVVTCYVFELICIFPHNEWLAGGADNMQG